MKDKGNKNDPFLNKPHFDKPQSRQRTPPRVASRAQMARGKKGK